MNLPKKMQYQEVCFETFSQVPSPKYTKFPSLFVFHRLRDVMFLTEGTSSSTRSFVARLPGTENEGLDDDVSGPFPACLNPIASMYQLFTQTFGELNIYGKCWYLIYI